MPEELIIRYGAPTLANIKTGSLFTVPYRTKAALLADMAALNRRLEPKGAALRVLRVQNRALVYLYRPDRLRQDFSKRDTAALLCRFGYAANDAEGCVSLLAKRLRGGGAFPHEIGLFLGYPAEDVRGFIEHRGADSKCVGAWKVYGDEDAARRRFARFEQCTAAYCKRLSQGSGVERLTVRSKQGKERDDYE